MKKSGQRAIPYFLPGALVLCCLVFTGCPTKQEQIFTKGEEEMKLLQYAQAYETFTRFLELEPKSSGGYYNRALALVGLDKFSDALDDLERAAVLDPQNTDPRRMRFRIQSMLREACRTDTTVSSAQRPMKQQLESVLSVSMLGELDKILEIDTRDLWALNERGRLKHDRREYNEALADYDEALGLCDTCTWLLYNKALTLRALWRTRDALAVLETVVGIDSLDGGAWLLLGECRFGLGMRQQACEAFVKSMSLGVAEAEERYRLYCR